MSRSNKRTAYIDRNRFLEVMRDVVGDRCATGTEYFSNYIGIGRTTVTRIVYGYGNGRCDPSIDTFVKLSKKTGVSIDWLLGLSDRKYIDE